jgi:glycosyltransferase involved in cell wall biosynthesis
LLVPPRDRAGFRDALQRLLPDAALRAELGANARAAVLAQYSVAEEARRYIGLFEELTESPS